MAGIGQSLAGRAGIVQLLPFSLAELAAAGRLPDSLDEVLFTGLYPPLHDRPLDPAQWFGSYILTYLERDLRQLANIHDLGLFQRFIALCAARTGQLLNLSALAVDCGISQGTAKNWIGLPANLFFWRDNIGHEVDLLLDQGERLQPIEIKSGQTIGGEHFAGLHTWGRYAGDAAGAPMLVYAGKDAYTRGGVQVVSWRDLPPQAAERANGIAR